MNQPCPTTFNEACPPAARTATGIEGAPPAEINRLAQVLEWESRPRPFRLTPRFFARIRQAWAREGSPR